MGQIVYVLFGHNNYGYPEFHGVFYSVEQAEEHMNNLIKGDHIYFYEEWGIIPQIVGDPDENVEEVIFYTSEGIRRENN